MEKKKWLYLGLVFLVLGVVSMIIKFPVLGLWYYSSGDPILFIILTILTVVGFAGATFSLLWWNILRISESNGK